MDRPECEELCRWTPDIPVKYDDWLATQYSVWDDIDVML